MFLLFLFIIIIFIICGKQAIYQYQWCKKGLLYKKLLGTLWEKQLILLNQSEESAYIVISSFVAALDDLNYRNLIETQWIKFPTVTFKIIFVRLY